MAKQKRIEVRIQTDRRVVIYATGLGRIWCDRCGAEKEFVGWQTAGLIAESLLLRSPMGELPVEVHLFATADGPPHVCLDSLLQLAGREARSTETNALKGIVTDR